MRSWPAPEVPHLSDKGLPGKGLPLQVYDSGTAALKLTQPGPVARLYVCGITPYDATHLGHASTYLAFDLVQRVWLDAGHDVHYVQNVTDVDDPLLERADATGVDWRELAEREISLFREDMTELRILPPREYVGAVEAIPMIIEMITDLKRLGSVYELDGDLYFPVSSDPDFGQVSGLDREQMLRLFAERGGDPTRPGKKDPLDALLWLAQRPGEPGWDSPFGRGRPGWQIECSAISLRYLGMSFDIEGGGSDLAFPHHEMGASHAQTATGDRPHAHAYVHAGMVALDGEKMSKSRGNLVFVSRTLAAGADPRALRLALLADHYRSDRMWVGEALERAGARVAAWSAAVRRPSGPSGDALLAAVRAAIADDLDTPTAIAAVDAWCVAEGTDTGAPELVRATVDALLGVDL
jgi:L-cysteine:1D-myo-inositol 2-amino-2-deoxy-alpha-D-glucopyranoside ligase